MINFDQANSCEMSPTVEGQTCYLLGKIPRELRDEIWRLAIHLECDIEQPGAYSSRQWILIDSKKYRRPSLLNVSRQLRLEAGEFYYGEIRMVFHRVDSAFRHLRLLDVASLRRIKMLSFAPTSLPHNPDMVQEVRDKFRELFAGAGIDVDEILHVRRRPFPGGMPRWVWPSGEEETVNQSSATPQEINERLARGLQRATQNNLRIWAPR